MSRSMRIQDLLSRSVIASDGDHTENRKLCSPPTSDDSRSTSPKKPKYQPINPVQSKQPVLNLLTWDLPPDEEHLVPRRKRKFSPEDAALIRTPTRLPRFSVNIFNAEPTNAYPIPYQGIVPRMIKYYIQTWAIEHGTALHIEGHPNPYQSLVFPYALHHGALFESMVCIARAAWLLTEGIPWRQDKALAYHRANAFAALALRMTSEKTYADDTTILTIAALSTVDYLLGIHEGAKKHVDAMEKIQKIRSDIHGDTPWEQLIIITIKAYDQLWKFVKDRNEATAGFAQLSIDSPLRNELPAYVSPPFNTKVCEALSKVSPAFNDMAMSGELSVQMIDILANLSSLMKDGTVSSPINSPRTSPESRGNLLHSVADLRFLSVLGITPIEHFLCYGLIACCYTLHFDGGSIGEEYVESLQELEDMLAGDGKQPLHDRLADTHRDCLIWISIAAAGALAMSELLSAMSMILDHTFDQFPDEMAQWDVLSKVLQKFLWSNDLLMFWKRIWQKAMVRRATWR